MSRHVSRRGERRDCAGAHILPVLNRPDGARRGSPSVLGRKHLADIFPSRVSSQSLNCDGPDLDLSDLECE